MPASMPGLVSALLNLNCLRVSTLNVVFDLNIGETGIMAAKDLSFESDARSALLSGVEKLAAAVKSTLGPRGRNAIIDKGWGGPTVTKDGVTVAEEIELLDKAENMGAKLVREAASKTSKVAGDGTTTATVLTEAIFKEAFRNLAAGADEMALNRGIQKAVSAAVDKLTSLSKPIDISKKDDIVNIASISASTRCRRFLLWCWGEEVTTTTRRCTSAWGTMVSRSGRNSSANTKTSSCLSVDTSEAMVSAV